ncbi:YcaO-like family protein [Streptomyces flaveolus]|uniref:YcaO-like family protein n=1 Tax=Streptomyces flaveolus TaxID=67297 RepID=UPI0033A5DCBF
MELIAHSNLHVDDVLPQSGERGLSLSQAFARGTAAAAELGLRVRLSPLLDGSPGTWTCTLSHGEEKTRNGIGLGKGDRESARTGALFEALEHHLSGVDGLRPNMLRLRSAHDISRTDLTMDVAVSMLPEYADAELACMPFSSLVTGHQVDVPLFLSVPDYLTDHGESLRTAIGDVYKYAVVGRYSANNGWAAGTDPVEAAVHAVNETIERDAHSLLLIDQFLGRHTRTLRLVDPATLPKHLSVLLERAQDITQSRVHLIDMTTDLGVPAFLAFLSPSPGQPARTRGCGASLSRNYAITRSLTELIQAHTFFATEPEPEQHDETVPYPPLHACRLADFTPMLNHATKIPYTDNAVPETPREHLQQLVAILTAHGFVPYQRDHYVTDNLSVVNIFVPGLERFMLICDGHLVVPGKRGLRVKKAGMESRTI